MNTQQPNHSHAWRGSWDRPMRVDEDSFDALTVARMTDHNVRGVSNDETLHKTKLVTDAEGHYDIDGASLAVEVRIVNVIASDGNP